jgi:hypothetical protein
MKRPDDFRDGTGSDPILVVCIGKAAHGARERRQSAASASVNGVPPACLRGHHDRIGVGLGSLRALHHAGHTIAPVAYPAARCDWLSTSQFGQSSTAG